MSHLSRLLRKFAREDRGLETVEYAIIAGIIVVATMGLIVSIGGWVYTKFNTLDTGLATGP